MAIELLVLAACSGGSTEETGDTTTTLQQGDIAEPEEEVGVYAPCKLGAREEGECTSLLCIEEGVWHVLESRDGDCDDDDPCTIDTCNPQLGTCESSPSLETECLPEVEDPPEIYTGHCKDKNPEVSMECGVECDTLPLSMPVSSSVFSKCNQESGCCEVFSFFNCDFPHTNEACEVAKDCALPDHVSAYGRACFEGKCAYANRYCIETEELCKLFGFDWGREPVCTLGLQYLCDNIMESYGTEYCEGNNMRFYAKPGYSSCRSSCNVYSEFGSTY